MEVKGVSEVTAGRRLLCGAAAGHAPPSTLRPDLHQTMVFVPDLRSKFAGIPQFVVILSQSFHQTLYFLDVDSYGNKFLKSGKLTVITFRAYSKVQIITILQERLRELPYIVFQPQAVELCARRVAAASGDMRKALSVSGALLKCWKLRKEMLPTAQLYHYQRGVGTNRNHLNVMQLLIVGITL